MTKLKEKKIRNDLKTAVIDLACTTYDECKEKLVTMYEPETNKTAERYRFRKMKDESLEDNIEEFKNRLWIQSEQCGFTDRDDQTRDETF